MTLLTRLPRTSQGLLRLLQDPLGFGAPLTDIALHPTELPSMTREARMEGLGG